MDTAAKRIRKDRQYFLTKVNGYSNELNTLKSSFQRQQSFILATPQTNNNSNNNNSSLTNITKLHESTAMLEETRRHLHHTHTIGDEVLTDLEAQKEVLISSHSKVKDTSNITTQASSILTNMHRRSWLKKLCLYAIIIVLAIVIILLSYYVIIRKHVHLSNI